MAGSMLNALVLLAALLAQGARGAERAGEATFADALSMYESKSYARSIEAFTRLLESPAAHAQSLLYLCRAYFRLGEFEKVVAGFSGVDVAEVRELVDKSRQYSKLRYESPAASIDRALEDCPGSKALLLIRIKHRLRAERYVDAYADVGELERHHGETYEVQRCYAQVHLLLGNHREGLGYLEKLNEKSLAGAFAAAAAQVDAVERRGVLQQKLQGLVELEAAVQKQKAEDIFSPSVYTAMYARILRRVAGLLLQTGTQGASLYTARLVAQRQGDEDAKVLHAKALIGDRQFRSAEGFIMAHFAKGTKTYAALVEQLVREARAHSKQRAEREQRREEERAEREKKEWGRREQESKERERRARERRGRSGRRTSDPDPEKFYEVLGVKPKAPMGEVKTAYRKIMRKYNAARLNSMKEDEKGKAQGILVRANKAKEVLLDKEKKEEYDSGRYVSEEEMQQWGDGDGHDIQQDILQMFFGGGFDGFGSGGGFHYRRSGGGGARQTIYIL